VFDAGPVKAAALLPETRDLLSAFDHATYAEYLDGIATPATDRAAGYRALPAPNPPFLRLSVASAGPVLLTFAGKPEPGFEVLEALRAGFQFHRRRDLSRTDDSSFRSWGAFAGWLAASRSCLTT
jgi:hypothetical protein